MKNTVKILAITILLTGLLGLTSCKKYKKYDNKEVVENTYPGEVELKGTDEPNGDFTGNNDSGVFSFVWDNPKVKADVDFQISAGSEGSVQLTLNDAKGKEVFNETIPSGGVDSFSGLSDEGKEGKWLVTIELTNFNGNGGYDIKPRD